MKGEFEKFNLMSRRKFLELAGVMAVAGTVWSLSKPKFAIGANLETEKVFDIESFSEEIKTNPYLHEAYTLMRTLNTMDQNSFPDTAAFLRDSDWYKEKQKNGLLTSKIEEGINQLNYTKVQGEPIQCIQWVNLLASLGNTDSPIIIGTDVRCARELIPDRVLEGSYRSVVTSKTGGDIIADPKLKISEIRPGNLFLKEGFKLGHVGAFLATKDVGGKRLILTTDSNYNSDGRIRMFTIEEDRNFDDVLGSPPSKKIILVKNRP